MRQIRDEGVSNVVSLIMIAGILISLLGMVFTTYLPAWGKDIEVKTQSEVLGSIMDLKSGMDLLSVTGDPGTSMTTKISLGSNGGPVFGFGRMTGSVQLRVDQGVMEITDDLQTSYAQSRGSIIYQSYNVEVDDISIAMEGGAIVRDQASVPVMKGTPNIKFVREPGTGLLTLYVLAPTIEGTTQSYSGTGTYLVKTVLKIAQDVQYDIDDGRTISMRFYTLYGDLWTGYFRGIAEEQDMVEGPLMDFIITQSESDGNPYVQMDLMTLHHLEVKSTVFDLSFD